MVPEIDLSGWRSGDAGDRADVTRAVDDAASTVGFMEIVGHGIPRRAASDLAEAMDEFFSLPDAMKRRLRPLSPSINRGYTAPRSERLSYSLGVTSPADLFEAFNVGAEAATHPGLDLPEDVYSTNLWPEQPPGFRPRVETWLLHARELAHTLTSIFAAALGLAEGYFEAFTDHSIDVLRMNRYDLAGDEVRLDPGQLGMGPHTDYGIVTVLWADAAPGLQILGPDGDWTDVVPHPGALLVNLGDLLARWTNDRWRSTLHRVLAPIDETGRPYRRRSAAFFHDGNADALVTTLPNAHDRGGERYEPVTVADHLAEKLAGSRGLRLNASATREAARLAARTSTSTARSS